MFSFSGILIWCTRQHGHLATPQRNFFWLWHQDTTTIADLIFVKIKNCVCVLILSLNRENQLCNDDSTTFFLEITLRVVGARSSHRFYFPIFCEISWRIGLLECFSFSNGREKRLVASLSLDRSNYRGESVPVYTHGEPFWHIGAMASMWFRVWADKFA